MIPDDHANRRQFLIGAASLAGGMITVLPVTDARATPDTMQAAIKKVVGSSALRKGKVTLRLPRWSRTATRSPWMSRSKADDRR